MGAYQILFWVFAGIAAGGASLGLAGVFRRGLPAGLSAVHGMAGLFGLGGFFLINLSGGGGSLAWWSLGVLLAALIGGLIFFRVLFPTKAPWWLMAGHGALAGLGLYLLYGVAYGL